MVLLTGIACQSTISTINGKIFDSLTNMPPSTSSLRFIQSQSQSQPPTFPSPATSFHPHPLHSHIQQTPLQMHDIQPQRQQIAQPYKVSLQQAPRNIAVTILSPQPQVVHHTQQQQNSNVPHYQTNVGTSDLVTSIGGIGVEYGKTNISFNYDSSSSSFNLTHPIPLHGIQPQVPQSLVPRNTYYNTYGKSYIALNSSNGSNVGPPPQQSPPLQITLPVTQQQNPNGPHQGNVRSSQVLQLVLPHHARSHTIDLMVQAKHNIKSTRCLIQKGVYLRVLNENHFRTTGNLNVQLKNGDLDSVPACMVTPVIFDHPQTIDVNNGTYDVVECIGSGSQGYVYKVTYADGRILAVKMIPETEKKELRILQTLSHDNIIKFVDVFQDSRHMHILMEWYEAGSLKNGGLFGRMKEETLKGFIWQVLKALLYLHNHGVIYSDLKGQLFFNCFNTL
jgi:hypothetical protein